MSFDIVLRREVEIELDEIFIWYEEQKAGLGFEFIKEFEAAVNKIRLNPYYASYASIINTDARSSSLKKFPYEVIYRIDDINRHARVIAVIHQHRNPEWFRQRMER